jgi:HEAT repeat protein
MERQEADEKIVFQKAFFREPLDGSAIPYLIKGLENANSGYRFRCAEALAKLGRSEGGEFLEKQFQSDDVILKVRAADALARVGDEEALRYLQEAAEKSTDEDVKFFVKRSLREIGI